MTSPACPSQATHQGTGISFPQETHKAQKGKLSNFADDALLTPAIKRTLNDFVV
jgi:hypothetical protein